MDKSRYLYNLLNELGAISYGSFVGKSGEKYEVETDIRRAIQTYGEAFRVSEEIYKTIIAKLGYFYPVIGVPETGTFLSFFINSIHYQTSKQDFYSNMLRAVPKEYQLATDSVYTVLPLKNEQEYILIEDDVVTGNTLLRCLKNAITNKVKVRAVVVVFGRKSAFPVIDYCKQNSIAYCELISVDDIS